MKELVRARIHGLPLGWAAVLLLLLVAYPLVFRLPFPRHIVIMALLFGTLGTAWNILGGYTGQVSIGHGLYYGIGAYTAGYFYSNFLISPLLTWPIALLISTAAAVIIGLPTFRLRGHYFVLASVFIVESVHIIVLNWEAVGAAIGIEYPVYKATSFLDAFRAMQFHDSKVPYYYFILSLFLFALFVSWRVQKSPLGFYLRSIREDQEAAQSLGVNANYYKLVALIISALLTTLCGMFYGQYILFLEPLSTVSLIISFEIAFIAIFGGIGTLWGPPLGAFIIIPLTEFLRVHLSGRMAFDVSALQSGKIWAYIDYYLAGGGGNIDLIVFGLTIMLVARFQPRGILGFFQKID